MWLEDEAGNIGSAARTEPLVLRFDDGAPATPAIAAPDRWLNAQEAANYALRVESQALVEPMSGLMGYSVSTDGTFPDAVAEINGASASHVIPDLVEGSTTVRARAVSGSGVPSVDAASAELRVDKSPPEVSTPVVPAIGSWHRGPVAVQITAADQQSLSGMDPAPDTEPIEDGAYVAYRLDAAAFSRHRGDKASVAVTADGEHSVRYFARDAAGNATLEHSTSFKIDQTPPTGAFRRPDSVDPRQLVAEVEDATSGVAGGWLEYRRVGDGKFQRMATTFANGQLRARIDDQGLPSATYQYRAVVRDVAGNEAVVDRWLDGGATTLRLPVRLDSRIAADLGARQTRCTTRPPRAKRKGVRKRKSRRRCVTRELPAVSALPFGTPSIATGRLTTVEGTPIGGATVALESQLASGGPFVSIGSARTDGRGAFRAPVPAGASRTVRYRYAGSNTVRPSSSTRSIRANAAARLTVSRRRLRNGQSVTFKGLLLGKPIPPAGKLVALQAKVGRRWRTFATPRARANGSFKHRYRFTATTGVRRYAFRALVTKEAAYPYEQGRSKTVRVVVRGRRLRR
jgi:hypothetical protein